MSLTHDQMHKLERRIADVIRHGHPKMDAGDAIQAGHDVADMLVTEYTMEDRDDMLQEMGVHGSLGEAVKSLRRLLSEPKTPFEQAIRVGLAPAMPAVQAAGFGGGVGEEV